MNPEEFAAAEDRMKDCNELAQDFYRKLYPKGEKLWPRDLLYGILMPDDKRHAWEMACVAWRYFHPDSPDPAELVHDYLEELNAQDDPCEIAKGAACMAA